MNRRMASKVVCPYCQSDAEWVENKEIYGENRGKSYMIYLCRKCDARVGCHNNSEVPLGTLADKELRQWRIKTHEHLDRLWKDGIFSRKEVYAMLKTIFKKEIHIGESDIKTCKEIIKKLQRPVNL